MGFNFSPLVNLTPHFTKCFDVRQPNTLSKYYKIFLVHNERPYYAAYKFQIDLLNSQTTFRQCKKKNKSSYILTKKETHINFNEESNSCENCPKKLFGMG